MTPMDAAPPQLRAAHPSEAEAITELALRSMRRCGYGESTMDQDMRLSAADVEASKVEVLAVDLSRDWGLAVMRLESDPHAEAFYLRLGAVHIGMSPSTAIRGCTTPLSEYRL